MKKLDRITVVVATALSVLLFGGCNHWDDLFENPDKSTTVKISDEIVPSIPLVSWAGYNVSTGLATRTLIDQITTRTLDSNFLRIDENIGSNNVGLYTFENWNKATMLEATVISSPDNTPNIYYRAVTFAPTQTYNIYISGDEANADTTFYHTRLVGWYPRNCTLQRNEKGNAVTALFENSSFGSAYVDLGGGKYGVRFEKLLDGRTDLMMSDLGEGELWHNPKSGETVYRQPFGHNEASPAYSNPLHYKHYLSVVRIWAYADGDAQNLLTWGSIEGLTFINQPTSCTIELPTTVGAFGSVVSDSWEDYQNIPAVTDYMYGSEDVNHQDDDYEATYPINMSGHVSSLDKTYLGYCLVRPEQDVEVSIRTKAGTFNAILPRQVTVGGNTTDLFKESKIYDFTLNLKTSGTMEIYIQNEDIDNFINLSPFVTEKGEYETANSYIIDADALDYTGEDYPGFCFCANIVGNGTDGLMSSGSTTFHTDDVELQNLHSAEIVWQSSVGLISNLQLQHGYIRFQLPGEEVGGVRRAVKGNAVLAVKDADDNIIWSWHIWITDKPSDITYTLGGSSFTIMDRNLGATAASFTSTSDLADTYGLYYQWGRKDPSPGPPSYNYAIKDMAIARIYDYSATGVTTIVPIMGNNTIVSSIEHPLQLLFATGSQFYSYDWLTANIDFLWGDGTNKTIYDPCPYGYRVQRDEIANLCALNPTYTPVLSDGCGGVNITYGGTTSFFPCAGYKGPDRGLPDSGGWRYVGTKGDYQGSLISTVTGLSQYHRNRVYLSKDTAGWSETSVGSYSGAYANIDYTNRKTAASVRCVKQ